MSYTMDEQSALRARFDKLQERLTPLWTEIGRSDPGGRDIEKHNTVVVLPSLTVDLELDMPSQQVYEERMLFMLFLLRQPRIRLIYLTSLPVPAEIVDYYLDILPSVSVNNARRRLLLVSPRDASPRPLVAKILERPRLVEHIRSLIPDLNMAHLVPFVTTDLERDLAVRLDIPMYAADPRYFAFGTKSGCRRIFAEEGVSHPLGEEDLRSKDDLVQAIRRMRAGKPALSRLIVKLNEGVSGLGNAQLSLESLPEPGSAGEYSAVEDCLQRLRFGSKDMTNTWYLDQLEKKGGIVEELITGETLVSPSAQLRITPLGDVEVLSTHDQMLGGESGQIYLGAVFPAAREYGPMIVREAEKVGRRLAREGVVGRFALDFIVVKTAGGSWDPYAIEINLRKGGTTHPFLTLQYLTDGKYDPSSGVFRTALGHPKYYVATDTTTSEAYRALTPEDLFDIVSDHRLHYDHISQTGLVLHMISSVGALGRLGLTAIGDTPEQAADLYHRFLEVLDRIAVLRGCPNGSGSDDAVP